MSNLPAFGVFLVNGVPNFIMAIIFSSSEECLKIRIQGVPNFMRDIMVLPVRNILYFGTRCHELYLDTMFSDK